MRRLLGSALPAIALIVSLTSCGDEDSGDVAQDPGSSSAASPTSSATSESPLPPEDGLTPTEAKVVDLITVTAAGGTVDPAGVSMDDAAAREAFLAQFKAGNLADHVQNVVDRTDVPEGSRLYAAVVAIGCDAPTDVMVTYSQTGVNITAAKVPSPKPECLAPMTTVALVQVVVRGVQLNNGSPPAS